MFTRALILTLALIALPAFAAEEFLGTYVRFTGTGTTPDQALRMAALGAEVMLVPLLLVAGLLVLVVVRR